MSEEAQEVSTALAVRSPERADRVPAAGEYWRVRRGFTGNQRFSLKRGRTLLVGELRRIDGAIHSVVLAAHPQDSDQHGIVMLLEDMLAHFIFEPQSGLIRANETAALHREMSDIQAALASGPPHVDLPALPASQSELRDVPPEQAQLVVQRHLALAREQTEWFTERHAEMQTRTTALANFYAEQAMAAAARVSELEQYTDSLSSGIKTMGLYIGDGVEVETLREGESAPHECPLTMFQRVLFMDEEYAVYRVLDGRGIWRSFDDFAKALTTDDTLLNRVLPTPRCVVAMKYTGSPMPFHGLMDIGSLQQAIEEARLDRSAFLLIRNGENVYRVQCDEIIKDLDRLFPTQAEKDKPFMSLSSRFHGVGEADITPASVRYYEARNEYDALMLFYRRLMVLMCGLHDRLGIFGEFYDRSRYSSFLSLDLQTERFTYIFDEESLALGDGRPHVLEWRRLMNQYLQKGSRVAVDWGKFISGSRVDIGHGTPQVRGFGEARVQRKSDGTLYLEVPVEYWSGTARKFKAPVTPQSPGILVLDPVFIEDLDYYVTSRVSRRHFKSFLQLFAHARALVNPSDSKTRADLIADLKSGYPDFAERAVNEAIRLARLQGASDIDDQARAHAATLAARYEKSLRIAAKHERDPICLIGTDLYLAAKSAEKPFGDALPHPWAVRVSLDDARQQHPVRITQHDMPTPDIDWTLQSYGVGKYGPLPKHMSLEHLQEIREAIMQAGRGFDALWSVPDVSDLITRYQDTSRRNEHDFIVPIGIAAVRDSISRDAINYSVLFLEEGLSLLWRQGKVGREAVGRAYANGPDKDRFIKWVSSGRPNLTSLTVSREIAFSDRDRGSYAEIVRDGFTLAYTHSVCGFERPAKYRGQIPFQEWKSAVREDLRGIDVLYLSPDIEKRLAG